MWSVVTGPNTGRLAGVADFGPSNAWAVSGNGNLAQWNGSAAESPSHYWAFGTDSNNQPLLLNHSRQRYRCPGMFPRSAPPPAGRGPPPPHRGGPGTGFRGQDLERVQSFTPMMLSRGLS
jgi:hypothetical protein